MHHFHLQYRHTMDDQRLRETIYPLMRRTFQTYLHVLDTDADGRLHIPLALSDEYDVAVDTSMNIALLRWGLQTLLAHAKRLDIDDPLIPKWREVLEKLVEYPVDPATGIMIGKDMPFSKPHRHYSHLFGIFPLQIFTPESHPEKVGLMRQSIDHFLSLDGDNCMYKFTGAASLYSVLGMGDRALESLRRALAFIPGDSTATPNTLYCEIGGWQTFESPISGARSMLDMLIQSWGGTIRVFPACPGEWTDVAFHDLRAEGGFLVSAVRKGGKISFVHVQSLAGEPCRIRVPWEDGPVCMAGPETANMRQSGTDIELDLRKGEEVILFQGDEMPPLVIRPLPADPATVNAWGLKAGEMSPFSSPVPSGQSAQ